LERTQVTATKNGRYCQAVAISVPATSTASERFFMFVVQFLQRHNVA